MLACSEARIEVWADQAQLKRACAERHYLTRLWNFGSQDPVTSFFLCPQKSAISGRHEFPSSRSVLEQSGDPQRKSDFPQHDVSML